jgi:hypothetical protein
MSTMPYLVYVSDRATEVATITELAPLAAAAADAGERYYFRARTPAGERGLTKDELLALMLATQKLPGPDVLASIAAAVERGDEHLARDEHGDAAVDDYFRTIGEDPDAARTDG